MTKKSCQILNEKKLKWISWNNHKPNSPYIPDHLYRILITGASGSCKTNVLLNLINHQRPDFDKIYLYVKDPFD